MYRCVCIIFSLKRKRNPAICSHMDGPEGTMRDEVSQTEEDEQYMASVFVDSKKAELIEAESRV